MTVSKYLRLGIVARGRCLPGATEVVPGLIDDRAQPESTHFMEAIYTPKPGPYDDHIHLEIVGIRADGLVERSKLPELSLQLHGAHMPPGV